MSNSGATSPQFTVFQFTLEALQAQPPTQRSRLCGSFSGIEEAFDSARQLATQTFSQLTPHAAFGSPALVDTEWGYDLRLGPLTVHRFWVHESPATQKILT